MAIRLDAEAPCLLRHFPLASTLHIVPCIWILGPVTALQGLYTLAKGDRYGRINYM